MSEIIDHHVAVDRDFTGLRVDLDLDRMRAVRMAWRLGRMTAGAFEPDAELRHRPHRREGCLRYFNEWDSLVGAGNREVASLNSMSPASASNMAAAINFALSMIASAARRSALPPTTALRAP